MIGAGVLGLAVARALSLRRPGSVMILERNARFGAETSSRNSEVIHAGLYYPPASLKAKFCLQGRDMLYQYCAARGIAHRRIGKLVVADRQQLQQLERLQANALASGVSDQDLIWLNQSQLQEREPAVRAEAALLSRATGIIDAHELMSHLLQDAESAGAQLVCQTELRRVRIERGHFVLHTGHPDGRAGDDYELPCRHLIIAAGLQTPALAARLDGMPAHRLPVQYPVKGQYFSYQGRSPFQHLIYPFPPESGQGLGIHATLDLGGAVRFGPDTEPVSSLRDHAVNPARKPDFLKAIRRYFPAVDADRLEADYAGIRPRSASSGFADFRITVGAESGMPGLIVLWGIDSPGLTASMALAEAVAERLTVR